MTFRFTITRRILAIILIIAIVPTAILGLLNYNNANHALINELKDTTFQSLSDIEQVSSMFMRSLEIDLTDLSKRPEVMNVSGNSILSVFQAYKESHPDALNIYLAVASTKQFLVYPSAELPAGFDPTSRPWYEEAAKERKLVWTDPYVDTATQQLVITAAAPVVDGQGSFVGIIGIDVSLQTLTSIIGNTKIGTDGHVMLTNKSGVVMVHPDSALLGKELDIPKLKQAMKEKSSGTVDYTVSGEKRFSVFSTSKKTGWIFIGDLSFNETKDATSGIWHQTLISSIIAAILAIIFGMFMSKSITKPLKTIVEETKLIGAGDFTVRTSVKNNHEIGILSQSLNTMVNDLDTLMGGLKNTIIHLSGSAQTLAANAEQTSAATEEVTATVNQIAKGASDQATAADQGQAMVSAMDDRLKEFVSRSEHTLKASENISIANQQGTQTLRFLMEQTQKNQASVDSIDSAIRSLDEKSKAIGMILTTITDIAGQTNLLALNAAIEAARAGEAGRGFAVVSDEIRKLAEQSAESAETIKTIIEDIQNESTLAVQIMSDVSQQSQAQTSAVDQVNIAFTHISDNIASITEQIQSISQNTVVLSENSSQLVTMISNVSAISEETAAASQEVTASMEQTASAIDMVAQTAATLNDLSEQLNEGISKFKVD